MPVFWWVRLDLIFLVGRAASSSVFWGVCELSMILGNLSVMGLSSFLASCLSWGVQHCSLLAIEWSCVFALRWRSLGELSLIDIMCDWEISGGPVS